MNHEMKVFIVVSCSVEYFDVFHFTHVLSPSILRDVGFTAAFISMSSAI